MGRTYICCDLKSFYASVECVERGLVMEDRSRIPMDDVAKLESEALDEG